MDFNEIKKSFIGDKKVPPVKAGDIVRVVQEFEDGSGAKQQIFEGVVISVSGSGPSKTFTVRKVTAGVGVEKIYPLHSPTIKKIEIKKSSKVKRAKLYWLRDRSGRAARLKEKDLDPAVLELIAAEENIKADKGKVSQDNSVDKKEDKGSQKEKPVSPKKEDGAKDEKAEDAKANKKESESSKEKKEESDSKK